MREVTDETFEAEVLRSPSRGRRLLGAVVRSVPRSSRRSSSSPPSGGVEFVRLDVDSNPISASRYDVLSLPTVAIFSAGELRKTVIGARSRKHYAEAYALGTART